MITSDGTLTGDIDEFGTSWLVKNLPKGMFLFSTHFENLEFNFIFKGVLFEENCKVNDLEECMPLPPDEDPCLWIMDEDKFGKVCVKAVPLNSLIDFINH
jgi:hypothetical protein